MIFYIDLLHLHSYFQALYSASGQGSASAGLNDFAYGGDGSASASRDHFGGDGSASAQFPTDSDDLMLADDKE